ncbi:MAG: C39 family peptidase [Gaiella sp.]
MTLTRCAVRLGGPGAATGWVEVAPFDELVASWAVPGDAEVEVVVGARRGGSEIGPYVLARRREGRWSSVPGQSDADARVEVDTLVAARPLDAFRLEARGVAQDGVRLAGVTSLRADRADRARARAAQRPAAPLELPVEPLSQQSFVDVKPHLDGGGASWCSPTSLTMVLRFHGVAAAVPDVAEAVYDPAYGGCGNWSFNVAHAADRGLDAVVTWLDGLAAAAELLAAGVPLVVSLVAAPGALPGFPLAAGTTGHLVVLAGLTAEGDPIVHDPAGREGEVRRVYPAAAFERCWVEGTGGVTYLVRPRDLALPPSAGLW